MELGAFSVSLAVKDINASKDFYEKIGFEVIGGELEQNWLIMRNSGNTVGLFQGMFDSNLMTFNPGWDANCQTLEEFADVRELITDFKSKDVEITQESVEGEKGPGSFFMKDPDGNMILIDQHV